MLLQHDINMDELIETETLSHEVQHVDEATNVAHEILVRK